MKKYFIRYKPFLVFIGTFFFVYLTLTVLYQWYLDSFDGIKTDFITRKVSDNTMQILSLFDKNVALEEDKYQPFIKFFYHQKYVIRIVEGCNAISVIILFVSFVVAFSGKLMHTLFFVFSGSLLIYLLNIMRIAALIVLLYHFPNQEHLLHGVLFPLLIYGVVFFLWIIWVNTFSKYASKSAK